MAGIESAKKNGVYKGRRIGWRIADVNRAWELHGKGLTNPEIAVAMKISVRTVVKYIGQKRESVRENAHG